MAQILYFEDLAAGQSWLTPLREITAEDVALFAQLTGDHTSLHEDNPGGSPFGKPVVHGLLGLSIMAGLSASCPNLETLALVSVGPWEFRRPIYFGDVVRAESEIVVLESAGRRAGRVFWRRRLLGPNGEVYQEGELETLVARRTPLRGKRKTVDADSPALAITNAESEITVQPN